MRKTNEDAMARTAAERDVAELLALSQVEDFDRAVELARSSLGAFPAVEFERGTSTDPDKQKVPMRRLVITGPWEVDPDGLRAQQQD